MARTRKTQSSTTKTAKVNEAVKPRRTSQRIKKQVKADSVNGSYTESSDESFESSPPVNGVGTRHRLNPPVAFNCMVCQKEFTEAKLLCDHQIKEHKVRKPPCPNCKQTFSKRTVLDRHLEQQDCRSVPQDDDDDDDDDLSCSQCDKTFSRRDNLAQHMKRHEDTPANRIKRYQCETCFKHFFTPSHLEIHNRIHTGERPFKCTECSKQFSNSGALKKHERTHTGEKPFKCDRCDQSFSLKGTLNRHMKIHLGIKPHKCEFCGKEFIQSGGLKAHLFFHTGKNGFRCEICDRQFNRKARLEMHKRYVHEKVKPYACDECKKSFTRKEDLLRHQILHTGHKPFSCQYCKKRFAIKGSLRVHMLTHRREDPRACLKCGHAFIRRDCLIRHIRKIHRDQAEILMLQHDLLSDTHLDIVIENEGDTSMDFELINGKISNDKLCDAIRELLQFVVDHTLLKKFGWPKTPVDSLLESLIKQCDCQPVSHEDYNYHDRLRENVKLLFTVVIEDDSLKQTLNNKTVDELILTVIMEAKQC